MKQVGRPKINRQKICTSINTDLYNETQKFAADNLLNFNKVLQIALREFLEKNTFENRIKTVWEDGSPASLPFIVLKDHELKLCKESGLVLIAVEKYKIVNVTNVFQQDNTDKSLVKDRIIAWLSEYANYKKYMGTLSSKEIYEPFEIKTDKDLQNALLKIEK